MKPVYRVRAKCINSVVARLIRPLLFVLKNMSFPIHPILLRHGIGATDQIRNNEAYVGLEILHESVS